MAQHDYVIANGTGAAVRSDLNSALAAIVSNNSGATEPTPTYAYQWWPDTTTGLLKIRNAANNAWVTVGTLASANLGLLSSGSTVTAALGSASTPGITFTGDTNTGIYSPGADQVAISTNGAGRLFVNSTGQINVGSGSFTGRLRIDQNTDTATAISVVSASANTGITSDFASLFLQNTNTTNNNYNTIGFINDQGGYSAGIHGIYTSHTAGSQSGAIAFGTSNAGSYTEKVRITATGAVGIGTTTVSDKLHVDAGNITLSYNGGSTGLRNKLSWRTESPFFDEQAYIAANRTASSGAPTDIVFATAASAGAATEKCRLTSDGKLLVGTSTAPSAGVCTVALQGNSGSSTDGAVLNLQRGVAATGMSSGDNLGFLRFGDNAGNLFAEIRAQTDAASGNNDFPGRLVFSTTADGASSPTERMRINSNGQVTIKTSVNTDVHVVASSASSGFTNAVQVIGFDNYAPNNTSARFIYCGDNAAMRAELRSNGGLANYQANNVNLSDINTKKDITPAADTWNCIKEWEIVNYRYKDQPDDADLNLGVIAQQVAESCPEVITVFQEAKEATEDEPAQEERLGVKEQQMYWMAIKALQEAQVRIEALEAEVAALKAS